MSVVADPPRLADCELIGRAGGSGLRETPYLVRRSDGQIVQLSELLYVIATALDGRDLPDVTERVASELGIRISDEQVRHVADHKLRPLGLLSDPDGSTPTPVHREFALALRVRLGLVPDRVVRAVANPLRFLFAAPAIVTILLALLAADIWLSLTGGVGRSLDQLLTDPTLGLVLFAATIASLLFHELGHAAACRYGGAAPGRIGVGVYLVWPVFFTDVTDSWRLDRRGRLRTDLGGVYFNALIAVAAAGAAIETGDPLLRLVLVTQQILILDQFLPWVRLDGYHVVSDLLGVPDLFSRIGPVLRSLGRRPVDPRVADLRPGVRAGVTTWVLSTVAMFAAVIILIATGAPGFLERAWVSLVAQIGLIDGGRANVVAVVNGGVGAVMLLLPAVAITVGYLSACQRLGGILAVRGIGLRRFRATTPPPARRG